MWSDGTPITADDVLFSYDDLTLNEDVDTNQRDSLELPDGTYPISEKIDDYTVKFTISTVYRPILEALGFSIMPKHKLAEFVHKLNPDVPVGTFNETYTLDTPVEDLVSMGPFMVESYQADISVTMVRNPYYYGYDANGVQLPYYDRLITHIVTNEDVQMLKFRNGEVDVYGNRPEDLAILLGEAPTKGFQVMISDDTNYSNNWFVVNQDIGLADEVDNEKRELYRNPKYREALSHLADTDTMIDVIMNGLGKKIWSPVYPISPFYAGRDSYGGEVTEADSFWYEYDPALAISMLDELGVVDQDGDGWRDLPSGAPLTIEFNTNDNTTRTKFCLILTEDFRAAGLNVNFQVVDFNTLVTRLLSSTGDMILLGLAGGGNDAHAPNVYRTCASLFAWRYSSCEEPTELDVRIDELIAAGVSTLDNDEAFEIYKEYQVLVAQRLGYQYLITSTFLYCYYDHVGNGALSNPYATIAGWRLAEFAFDNRL